MSFELIIPFLRPIEHLLLDDEISEIMCNPDSSFWIEREGVLCRAVEICFQPGELNAALEVVANRFGKQLDADHPILNVRLPDGSRLSAIISPIVGPEPLVNIRKFGCRNFCVQDLGHREMLTMGMAQRLTAAVREEKNILISGGTGTGKTTLAGALANEISDEQRIFVIEDTAEIHINKPHVISSEAQSNTHRQEVNFDTLLKAALRHRPDRIILGEVRGPEARTFIDAMNTGHRGTLCTVHASSADGAIQRVAALASRGSQQLTFEETENEVRSCIDVVVHLHRVNGHRCAKDIVEVAPCDRCHKREG